MNVGGSPTVEIGITSNLIKVQTMRVNMETEIKAKERFENANTIYAAKLALKVSSFCLVKEALGL